MEWKRVFVQRSRPKSARGAQYKNSRTIDRKVQNKENKDTILSQEVNGHDHDDGERNRTDRYNASMNRTDIAVL